MFLLLIILFSITAIQASDVNATDSQTINSIDDVPLQIENNTQLEEFTNDDATLGDNNKNQTQLSSPTNSIYGHYNVILNDSNSALANRNVSFTVNNVKYVNRTDNDGIASLNLKLNPGNYTITSYFSGDDDYESSKLTSTVEILPTIIASNITKYYKGTTKYSAVFLDVQGNPLKDTLVNITVNGKTYSKKTNNNGIASLKMNFKPGTFNVISTNPVTGYKSATTFKILSTITSSDLKKVKGDSRKFVVKFFKGNGKVLSNKKIKIKINGKVKKVKTNSKGKVKLSLNNLKKGEYKVVCYNKDGLSKSNTVKIYNIATTKLKVNISDFHTFLPNDTKNIKIKFSTNLDDDAKVGKSIKINLDGVTYSRKTDSNGVVNFKLPVDKGFFTIGFEYKGNKFFKSSKVKNSITILDTTKTNLTVKSTTRFGYGADTPFKVSFNANGVPLVKRIVTFNINGKTYKKTTDNNGIASVPITLNLGNYTVSYSVPDDSYVTGTSGSCKITVFKRSPSKLTWECGKSYKDNLQAFKVLLVDSNGKPLSLGNIELTIDGETYSGKTASNGYAIIKTAVPLGKYKVSVNFTGSNGYLPSSTSKSITVKLSKFGKGLNQKTSSSYSSAYLKSSSYCQVNNAKIKALVKSLTSGLTNNVDKAKAIFDFVCDEVEYDHYYNSHKGAVSTLNTKSGNCADQAHLLVAMYRTAGFKARYVHGVCKFSDETTGHVWTQVLVDKTWICGDPSSCRNSLGKINNWNTNSYRIHTTYTSLPF